MNKKWTVQLIVSILILMFLVGIINFIVDPFLQYRQPLFYKKLFTSEEQRYINAGLIKNYEFDSVLIGSSMVENFSLEKMQKSLDFNNPIKLCLNGGSAYEHKIILENVLKRNKISNVLMGLDYFSYEGPVERMDTRGVLPLYLYDDILSNDYQYIFNIDTLKKSIEVLVRSYLNKNDPRFSLNHMYSWQHLFDEEDFNEDNVVNIYKTSLQNHEKKTYIFEALNQSFKYNTLSIVQKNKNVNFTFIFPIYSVLQYKQMQLDGSFDAYLNFKTRMITELLKEDNVQIFDFQIASDIMLNLSNYRDLQHYHSRINSWMLQEIRAGNYKVEWDNITKNIEILKKIVTQYSVESFGI